MTEPGEAAAAAASSSVQDRQIAYLAQVVRELKAALRSAQARLDAIAASDGADQRHLDQIDAILRANGEDDDDDAAGVDEVGSQLASLAGAIHEAVRSIEKHRNNVGAGVERRRRACRAIAAIVQQARATPRPVAAAATAAVPSGARCGRSGPRRPVDRGGSRSPPPPRAQHRSDQTRAATVDAAMAHLAARFKAMRIELPLERQHDFVYRLGSKVLTIAISDGRLVVRLRNGSVDLLEFIDRARV